MMVAVTTNDSNAPIPADADGSHDGVSAVMADYKLAEHEKNRAWKILAAGSVAGTLSGLMGTLAGQPGPPLILMFALLRVPKVLLSHALSIICLHTKCASHMYAALQKIEFFCCCIGLLRSVDILLYTSKHCLSFLTFVSFATACTDSA